MPVKFTPYSPDLVRLAKYALGVDMSGFARAMRTSVRTAARWQSGESTPSLGQLAELARRIYPKDRALAAQLAAAADETLVSLKLEAPPAPPAPPPRVTTPGERATEKHLAKIVLCAAAEALDVPPHAVRPAIAAALKAMCELGMSPEIAARGLEADAPPKSPGPSSKRFA
jgi:hypothetical protein